MGDAVTAEVKGFNYFTESGSPDVEDGSGHFGIGVQVFIGTHGDSAADSFDVHVCSSSWFAERMAAGGVRFKAGSIRALPEDIVPGVGVWFMPEWSQERFEEAVRTVCRVMSPAPDWGSLAARLGRLLPWEFDYRYDSHVNERYGEPFPSAE